MSLAELHIHAVRNIAYAQLSLHPEFNVISGCNGSGKTSLLEAFYLLSSGYSFKTRETSPLVHYGEKQLTVFARTFSKDTISLQKNISGPTQVKINGVFCQNNSSLARMLPCQIFYQDIFQIIDAGPSVRRHIIDWGVFHVKHQYHELWRQYRHVLKQRNALLRQRPHYQLMLPWDMQLCELAEKLDELRQVYFTQWQVAFKSFLSQLSDVDCDIIYYRGWRESSTSLFDILQDQFSSDCQRQYTQSGAHQADIRFQSAFVSAKQGLSRGQQKMILIALKLAQAHLIDKECLYLFDDVTAELDQLHINRLMNCLENIKGQKILTVLDPLFIRDSIDHQSARYQHLNQGCLT